MGCQHLEDEYELYLLGALPRDGQSELDVHLSAQCPNCLEGLREAAESVYWLLQSVAPVKPRPAVKARLAARLGDAARGGRTRDR
jgi:hypothetical protein